MRHQTWFIYVESKAGKMVYFAETNLGEQDAMDTAADLIAKGRRVAVTNQHVGDGYFEQSFNMVNV